MYEEIEVDKQWENDDDSTYESAGYDTSTESLANSIHEYIFENGRRYHSYFGVDKYVIPVDEKERDRLDLNHEIILQLLNGRLHGAPSPEAPGMILDVGTGSGIWAIDMAEKYPEADVLGIDLSPIQPSWVPPNCRFEVDDAEEEWLHPDNSFDFIHLRNLNQGISKWPEVVEQAFRCVKPGCYVELSEGGQMFYSDDGSMRPDSPAVVVAEILGDAMLKIGRPPVQDGDTEKRLRNGGFVDIESFTLKMVFGPWPKDPRMKKIGIMNWVQADTAFHAYGMAAFTRVLGLSSEEADRLCNEASAATKKKNEHMYMKHYVAYGRKPCAEEDPRYSCKRKGREDSPGSGNATL